MGKKSDQRKFRRRRRWAGFSLLVSFALVVFGVQFLVGVGSTGWQPTAAHTAKKAVLDRVKSPGAADAPNAISEKAQDAQLLASDEEDVKTKVEKESFVAPEKGSVIIPEAITKKAKASEAPAEAEAETTEAE